MMKLRKNKILTTFLIFIFLGFIMWFLFFRFSGDGEYRINGVDFPLGLILKNHILKFPAFEIENEKDIEFKFKNYNSMNSKQLSLRIESPNAISFWKLSSIIKIEIFDSGGNLVFIKNTPLNSHFNRMVADGKTSSPKEDEWLAFYQYHISYQAVPFNSDMFPSPQIECIYLSYSHPNIKWFNTYIVKVKILNHPEEFKGLKAQLEISSSWK